MTEVQSITVVAAVIRDDHGNILLARRPKDRHMGGLWEFPGGKIDAGEAPEEALRRELSEELGVSVGHFRPITFAVHQESGLRILLLFYSAEITSGSVTAREGQDVAWVAPDRLPAFEMPPADADLIDLLAGHSPP